MRYQFIGKSLPCKGKTLWEIVGNLKNFGVGRLIYLSGFLKYPEPSFYKILKVIPLPPPKKEFAERKVIVWVEGIFRGIKCPDQRKLFKTSHIPQFCLIPKTEEELYLKKAEAFDAESRKKVVPRYAQWPPLYKELWEIKQKRQQNNEPIPKLKKVIFSSSHITLSDGDEESEECSSNLYKSEVPVEDMIKEIVRLQKIVNTHSQK